MMFKIIAVMTLCVVCGVVSSPTVLYSRPLVVLDAAQDAKTSDLPGIANLDEKSLPGLDSQYPQYQSLTSLPGTKNNAEKTQIEPRRRGDAEHNAEKAIPDSVLDKFFRRQGN